MRFRKLNVLILAISMIVILFAGAMSAIATEIQSPGQTFNVNVYRHGTTTGIEGAAVVVQYRTASVNPWTSVAGGLTDSGGNWGEDGFLSTTWEYRVLVNKTGYSETASSVYMGNVWPASLAIFMPMHDTGIFGRITGDTVTTPVPLPYAEVTLYELTIADNYETRTKVTADAVGDYYVPYMGSGPWRVKAWEPGYFLEMSNAFEAGGGWGQYDLDINLGQQGSPERVAMPDRYQVAVDVARRGWTDSYTSTWADVHHVIIASGEDRASADPLAAAGLCGVYDAPLFLVSSTGVSIQAKQNIKQIVDQNRNVTVHIVGGPVSVPDARFDEIQAYVGTAGTVVDDRILATGGRYDLSAAIAERMKAVNGGVNPDWVLVANGADNTKFFDALALSPISAYKQFPILLVSQDAIPPATKNALDQLGSPDIVVGGGPATVSDTVKNSLDSSYGAVERWSGADRYKTATTIADKSVIKSWNMHRTVGIAAKLPDALSGGAMVGRYRGVLLLTQGDVLTPSTRVWLETHKPVVKQAWIFGGTASVEPGVEDSIRDALN